jgi:hypothetical protein
MKRWFHIAVASVSLLAALTPASAEVKEKTFNLTPEKAVLNCLSADDGLDPTAQVILQRGKLNDVLMLHAEHLKPNTGFDLFTVQRSNLLADGSADPNFTNFGLAWYQTDLESDSKGEANVVIKTILLDQIFGFDPAAALPPTNTFNVGFWFNNPRDAAACGFDTTKPTPFNGEHRAGPAAMISLPDAETGLGPLCTSPHRTNTGQFVCNP